MGATPVAVGGGGAVAVGVEPRALSSALSVTTAGVEAGGGSVVEPACRGSGTVLGGVAVPDTPLTPPTAGVDVDVGVEVGVTIGASVISVSACVGVAVVAGVVGAGTTSLTRSGSTAAVNKRR